MEALLSIVIERSVFEYGRNFALLRHWLAEEEEEEKKEPTRRTFTRPDGNIGVQLRKELVTVTDAYLSCQSLLVLSDEQVREFQRRNHEQLKHINESSIKRRKSKISISKAFAY